MNKNINGSTSLCNFRYIDIFLIFLGEAGEKISACTFLFEKRKKKEKKR